MTDEAKTPAQREQEFIEKIERDLARRRHWRVFQGLLGLVMMTVCLIILIQLAGSVDQVFAGQHQATYRMAVAGGICVGFSWAAGIMVGGAMVFHAFISRRRDRVEHMLVQLYWQRRHNPVDGSPAQATDEADAA